MFCFTLKRVSVLVGGLLLLPTFSASAFTVNSENVDGAISGRAPTINSVENIGPAAKKLGFKIDGKYINNSDETEVPVTDLAINETLKIGDLKTIVDVQPIANKDYAAGIADLDGDNEKGTDLFITVEDAVEIIGADNKPVDLVANAAKTICDIPANNAPYKIVLTGTYIAATTYGHPKTASEEELNGSDSAKYKQVIKQEYNMNYENTCLGSGDVLYLKPNNVLAGNKAPSAEFVADKGFVPTSGFPTRAFKYAAFTVEVDGKVENFDFSVNMVNNPMMPTKPAGITADKAFRIEGNKITFISRYLGGAEVVVKRKGSNQEVAKYPFTVQTWYEEPGVNGQCTYITTNSALSCQTLCQAIDDPRASLGQFRIASPAVYSNSQSANDQASRGIGTLFGEWGNPIGTYEGAKLPGKTITSTPINSVSNVSVILAPAGLRGSERSTSVSPAICIAGNGY